MPFQEQGLGPLSWLQSKASLPLCTYRQWPAKQPSSLPTSGTLLHPEQRPSFAHTLQNTCQACSPALPSLSQASPSFRVTQLVGGELWRNQPALARSSLLAGPASYLVTQPPGFCTICPSHLHQVNFLKPPLLTYCLPQIPPL